MAFMLVFTSIKLLKPIKNTSNQFKKKKTFAFVETTQTQKIICSRSIILTEEIAFILFLQPVKGKLLGMSLNELIQHFCWQIVGLVNPQNASHIGNSLIHDSVSSYDRRC